MSTPTTSLETIRENMETQMEALTPTKLAQVPFRVARGMGDFETWAEKENTACLRRYMILDNTNDDGPQTTDTLIEYREGLFDVVIAYPKTMGTYGAQNIQDADDLIRADIEQLDGVSGIGLVSYGSYVSGQHRSDIIGREIDRDGESVIFARLSVAVEYYRSVPT